jgi:Nif-specific regulatory protein
MNRTELPVPVRFENAEPLGSVGSSALFRARDSRSGRTVVIKIMKRPPATEEEHLRFDQEFRLLSSLDHPNIVRLIELGWSDSGCPWYSMEALDGQPLSSFAKKGDWTGFARSAYEAASALAHAHARGIIHLAIEPGNIVVVTEKKRSRAVLTGFAIARPFPDLESAARRGGLGYIAPEILRHAPFDRRADFYSLGATLYAAATGGLPGDGAPSADALRFAVEADFVPPSRMRPDLPPRLEAVILRLLARPMARRYPSAEALLEDLRPLVDPTRRVSPTPPARGEILSAPLVVGGDVLAAFDDLLQAARAGRGGAFGLAGDEAMGKSLVLRELEFRTSLAGGRAFFGRTVGHRRTPFGPFAGILASMKRGAERESEALDRVLGWLSGDTPPPEAGREVSRFALFEAIGAAIASVSEGRLTAILLDDLHEADRSTLDLAFHLVRILADSPVVFVGAFRPGRSGGEGEAEEREDLLERFRAERVATLALSSPGPEGVRELVEASLGQTGLPEPFVEAVAREGQGAPGAMLRVLREIAEGELLRWSEGRWEVSPEGALLSRITPSSAADFLRRRVERMPKDSADLLSVASVLADPFSFDLAARLAGSPGEEILGAFDRLVRDGLLVPDFAGVESSVWAFSSESLRQATYAGLDPERRRDLHEAVARILEATAESEPVDRIGLLAFHYGRGRDHDRGADFSIRAAERAEGIGAAESAAVFLRAALDLFELTGDDRRRAWVRERLADLHLRAGRYRPALASFHFLLEALGMLGMRDPETRGRAARLTARLATIASRRGEHPAAVARWKEAVALLSGASIDGEEEVELLGEAALELLFAGELDAAFECVEKGQARGVEPSSRSGLGLAIASARVRLSREGIEAARGEIERVVDGIDPSTRGELARRLARELGPELERLGDAPLARRLEHRALEAAVLAGDPAAEVDSLLRIAGLDVRSGNPTEAIASLERAVRLERRLGHVEGEAEASFRLGEVFELGGRWSDARSRYRDAIDRPADPAASAAAIGAKISMGGLCRKRGELEEALRLVSEARTAAEAIGDGRLGARACHGLARIDKDTEDWEGAHHWLELALDRLGDEADPADRAPVLVSLADLALRRGEGEGAAGFLELGLEAARRSGDRVAIGKATMARARVEFSSGKRSDSDRFFAEAATLFEQIGAPYELGRCWCEWGIRIDDEARALEMLERAAKLLAGLGASLELERVRGAASRIRERGREGRGGSPADGRGGVIGLYEVAKVINSTLDLDEVLERVLDLARARLKAERGILTLLDAVTSEPRIRAKRSIREGVVPEERERFSEAVTAEVLRTGRSILSADAREDRRLIRLPGAAKSGVVSCLGVPVLSKERVVGAIYVDHGGEQDLFVTKDLAFLEAFADQAAIAIENARLYGELVAIRSRLAAENETLREEVLSDKHLEQLVGRGENVARIQYAIRRAAASNATVLLRGESGTGKGLVARLIHVVGPRANGPFIKFNAAALPETLVESELFGHEKGAFTGADRRKLGRFELARGGTIFLDEIGKISLGVQSKLLRVVEDKEFERVGGTETIRVDCKILAATNLDIENAIARNEFREDLFYRLNIIPILLPPLRERREDIPVLAEHFVRKICLDMGQDPRRLAPGVLELFRAHPWPGNVRELEGAIHRAIVMSSREELVPEDFVWMGISGGNELPAEAPTGDILHPAYRKMNLDASLYENLLARVDRELVERALAESGGKLREAARRLGLARNTLRSKVRKLGLTPNEP